MDAWIDGKKVRLGIRVVREFGLKWWSANDAALYELKLEVWIEAFAAAVSERRNQIKLSLPCRQGT
jgi:hypothetical protein